MVYTFSELKMISLHGAQGSSTACILWPRGSSYA